MQLILKTQTNSTSSLPFNGGQSIPLPAWKMATLKATSMPLISSKTQTSPTFSFKLLSWANAFQPRKNSALVPVWDSLNLTWMDQFPSSEPKGWYHYLSSLGICWQSWMIYSKKDNSEKSNKIHLNKFLKKKKKSQIRNAFLFQTRDSFSPQRRT